MVSLVSLDSLGPLALGCPDGVPANDPLNVFGILTLDNNLSHNVRGRATLSPFLRDVNHVGEDGQAPLDDLRCAALVTLDRPEHHPDLFAEEKEVVKAVGGESSHVFQSVDGHLNFLK